MVHFGGRNEHQSRPHEGVGGLPLVQGRELFQPSRKAFDETHARRELLVFVVFDSGQDLKIRPFAGNILRGPLEYRGEQLLRQSIPHSHYRRGHWPVNRQNPSSPLSASRYRTAACVHLVPRGARFQPTSGRGEGSSTLRPSL